MPCSKLVRFHENKYARIVNASSQHDPEVALEQVQASSQKDGPLGGYVRNRPRQTARSTAQHNALCSFTDVKHQQKA